MRTTPTLAAAGAFALLAAALPATAAPVAPAVGPYVPSVQCMTASAPRPAVTAGVSDGQRSTLWAGLSGLSTGAGVTVAVIDSGVNPKPSAFGDRLVGGGDLVYPKDGRNGLLDCDGHGTVVAGLIAGAPDRTTGFTGVAPGARILSIRQSSNRYAPADRSQGGNTAGDRASLAQAIDLAVAQGAKVINISAAACGPAVQGDHSPLTKAVERAVAADVVVVASAGNVGEGSCDPQNPATGDELTAAYPAAIRAALTVGAVTSNDAPADYSLAGSWVDVAAPGDHLVSVNPHPDGVGQVDALLTPDGVTPIQGTSFSAPVVSGVVALVRARYPRLTAAQVMHRITVTAAHPPGPGERTRAVGYGVVDPRMALTAVLPEEGAAGTPSSSAPVAAGLPTPDVAVDDPLPRTLAVGGTAVLGLAVVAFAVVRLGRRPR